MVRTNNIKTNVVRTKMQEDNSDKNRWGDIRPGTTKKFIRFPNELLSEIYDQLPDNPNPATRDKLPKVGFSEWVKDACQKKLKD